MIKIMNLDKEKYCEDDYKITTILKIKNYAIQILKSKEK